MSNGTQRLQVRVLNSEKRTLNETAYQLLDGFAVNMGYFSIHANLGGTFDTVHEAPDPKKHPLTFRFRPLRPMRELAESTRQRKKSLSPPLQVASVVFMQAAGTAHYLLPFFRRACTDMTERVRKRRVLIPQGLPCGINTLYSLIIKQGGYYAEHI